ncbi:MAG TPA: hypothetical protein PL193_01920 [Xanthobacteraceae bacterium]|nr:hypothetical protein [Xanthobacteraceae bacterium]
MKRAKTARFLRLAVFLAPLSLSLAACETLDNLNPFEDKKTPLSGDRRSLFPDGVPGVERNAPPQQPTNSNIQIPAQQPEAQTQQPPSNNSEDPWAGRRR